MQIPSLKVPTPAVHVEPRWPVALAILASLWLLTALQERIRLVPAWATGIAGLVVLAPMVVVAFGHAKRRWLAIERIITLAFVTFMAVGTLVSLAYLIDVMIHHSTEVGGLQLLASSVGVWITNVLLFSLLHWQIDRGGPVARWNGDHRLPDLLFAQQGAPVEAVPAGWRPAFVDYLFFSFSTATAFSATDTLPLTARAKLSVMLESAISLVTLVVVGARAINILAS